jgi:hypothetical protein
MNVRFRFAISTLCVVFLGLLAPSVARANIVTNGNFSSGSAGWTYSTWSFGDRGDFDGNTNYADTGCVNLPCITGGVTSGAYLYQDLPTVAGDSYTLSFEYTPDGGTFNELEVLFGGAVVDTIVNAPNTDYVLYTYIGLVATSTSTQLAFLGRQDPAFDRLTNVDVEGSSSGSATPEPSSLYLLGTGLAGLAGLLRRKLRA